MMHISFYCLSIFLQWKKEKVVKAFLFNILTSDYDRCEGFLRPSKKSEKVWLKKQISGRHEKDAQI